MGGEKRARNGAGRKDGGSPPRGRGKVRGLLFSSHCARITPAWAGKSIVDVAEVTTGQDHPRVGGEKAQKLLSFWPIMGSPPRGRGKVHAKDEDLQRQRITPAWAGKREHATAQGEKTEDHPRVGGEKFGVVIRMIAAVGSPPRGRGKACLHLRLREFLGITPAWAGKRCVT